MRKRPDPDKSEGPDTAPRFVKRGPSRVSVMAIRKAQGLSARHGVQMLSVATRWRDLVGAQMAAHVQPLSISYPKGAKVGGTIVLRADGGAALLVQHHTREILARVNALLGEGSIVALRLSQGELPIRREPPKPPPPRLGPGDAAAVRDAVQTVQDPDLRAALEQLMRHSVVPQRR